MTGTHLLNPILIGKAKNPRAFKDFYHQDFVNYQNSKKAWMTSNIFDKFLKNWDNLLKYQRKKICIFVDNCPSHKILSALYCIEVIFLPPNTTSIFQPMDVGIIKTLKTYFNGFKLLHISDLIEGGMGVEESFKSLNLRNVAVFSRLAWKKVSSTTVKNCFSHVGLFEKVHDSNEDILTKEFEEECKSLIVKNNKTDSITFDEYREEDFNFKNIVEGSCEEGERYR